ncbi:MAG: type II secretion system protein [Sulfurimonas sp.]|nr:type II secretion system protein [Sulfurimonas sp.]
MLKRNAFSMIELIFVIVIMGIIGKFGVEFLAQAYRSFIFSSVNHNLQASSGAAVELIAARLQHRIKDSVIARTGLPPAVPVAIGSVSGNNYTVLEWVGVDYEGFKGNSNLIPCMPNWSGILDLNHPNANSTTLISPSTDTSQVNTMISNLSYGHSSISNAAIFFIGANSNVQSGYGWDGNLTAINLQQGAMHPITNIPGVGNEDRFSPRIGNFTGIDVYEYYQLAWTAYAIVYEPGVNNLGTLRLYWDYQPWEDEDGDGNADQFNTPGIQVKNAIIMENVSTFQFTSVGDIIKIQVCTKSTIIDGNNDGNGYSLCKEKTVF